MRMCLLTEDEHMAAAARFAGMESIFLYENDAQRWQSVLRQTLENPEIAVLMVSPKMYTQLRAVIEEHRLQNRPPYVLRAPEYGGAFSAPRKERTW